jgi:hypothetical protein
MCHKIRCDRESWKLFGFQKQGLDVEVKSLVGLACLESKKKILEVAYMDRTCRAVVGCWGLGEEIGSQ